MIVHPETYADQGCWVSDDRVYAFVSSAAAGIGEIGYHGSQPVSRNVRVFFSPEGVCRFSVLDSRGNRHTLRFEEVDWFPGSVAVKAANGAGSLRLLIRASGRDIFIVASEPTGDVRSFTVHWNKRSHFTEVHGQRTWTQLRHEHAGGRPRFQIHDVVLLDAWMKREGPYGADFLIPEPVRRTIFRRQVRSGLATPADLLEEFSNVPYPIYDCRIHVDLGGDGYDVHDTDEETAFTIRVDDLAAPIAPFGVRFDGDIPVRVKQDSGVTEPVRAEKRAQESSGQFPVIQLPGFRRIEEYFSTVPGLVASCIVRDFGVPRATPGGYYWIWAWDAMVTALVALRWGATELAGRTAAFVHANRDNGLVPMRWTHSLEPLDSQPPGALETLLASLVYALTREKPGSTLLQSIYPHVVRHLDDVVERSDRQGLFSNMGFYPDLPLRFGRKESSASALEVAAFYAFCRTCENSAELMHDEKTARVARRMSTVLEDHFDGVFWDPGQRFFVDAVDMETGLRNLSYPLFTLLFLHCPSAIRLIRRHLEEAADFIGGTLLTPSGMRMLPAWDKNAGSETVSDSWYPHWDWYALKLFRRAGRPAEIMSWLRSVESVLEHLGYVPEYLSLDVPPELDSSAWRRHGAASNLNCVTGWYQALLEGVMGLDFDPGGLTIVPLALPLAGSAVQGIHHLGTRWNVAIRGGGPWLHDVRLDGEVMEGCMKVIRRMHDGGEHSLELRYDDELPRPHFLEMANAEVIEVEASPRGIEAEINALGWVELVFFAPENWELSVDGRPFGLESGRVGERTRVGLPVVGKHMVQISPRL